MIDKKVSPAQWKKMRGTLLESSAPAGFTRSVRKGEWGGQELVLKNDDGVELIVSVGDKPDAYFLGVGTTNFTTKLGKRTFDRLGVDNSFYVDKPEDLPGIVEEQLRRVAEARARIDRSETVPGLPGGFTVTPERKAEVTKLLKAGRSYSFTPSGFGTGYCLSTRRTSRWTEKASDETARFFGVTTLFFDRMDCD